ncbi:MAG: 1-acyl-sn-glycerol-3-phosphate acyltransferase, partial [Clostridia bacterium]|nr:1-acyl-sn-glycerol-3-phosphate acyltransferase [Clostridia bacterium]
TEKLAKYDKAKTSSNVMLLMYLLFITPIIPFGAICYFAANKNISYRRYVFTCATGVVPSILTSNVMGYGIRRFIANSLPLWALLLIIIGGAIILFTLLMIVLNKFYFKQGKGTPDSPYCGIISALTKAILLGKIKVKAENTLSHLDTPYLALANHSCFYDYYFLSFLKPKKNFSYVVNDYYFRRPVLGGILEQCGEIPKKLFEPDVGTIKGIMSMIKRGYSVAMFPEGRLTSEGRLCSVNKAVVPLIRKLGVPLVLISIKNAYLAKPKWRKKIFRSSVFVRTEEIIFPEAIETMTDDVLYGKILSALAQGEEKTITYKENGRAKGIEKVLYKCPSCLKNFDMESDGNSLKCKSCGRTLTLNENYEFDDENIRTIADYYEFIKGEEEKGLSELNLTVYVNAKIFKKGSGKYEKDEGVFTLTPEGVTYKSMIKDYGFEKKVSSLEAIAYSVGEEFEMYNDDRLHYFYPKKDRNVCVQVALVYDLLRRKEEEKAQ